MKTLLIPGFGRTEPERYASNSTTSSLDAISSIDAGVGTRLNAIRDRHVSEMEAAEFTAYVTNGQSMPIVAAHEQRAWMERDRVAFANRCLPMRIAGQAGWFILNPAAIEVCWNGGKQQKDLSIRQLSKTQNMAALSHFGHGVLTWWIPYLFRTPPGYNMHVRGPANWCKDGATALDAIVETDWSVASFPMSWKLTRVNTPIRFEQGEPICMISPLRRFDTERFQPVIRDIREAPDLQDNFRAWSASRRAFNLTLTTPNPDVRWQKHYFLGTHPNAKDKEFPDHQVRLCIHPPKDYRSPAEPPSATPRTDPDSAMHETASTTRGCPIHLFNNADKDVLKGAPPDIWTEPNFFEQADEIRAILKRNTSGDTEGVSLLPNVWQVIRQGTWLFCRALLEDLLPADLLLSLSERFASYGSLHGFISAPSSWHVSLYLQSRNPTVSATLPDHSLRFFLPLCLDEGVNDPLRFVMYTSENRRFRKRQRVAARFNELFIADPARNSVLVEPAATSIQGSFVLEGYLERTTLV